MLAIAPKRRSCLGLGLTLVLCACGCRTLVNRPEPRLVGPQTPPHYGQMVPTEKDKTTLPPYTIEPPDILFVEAIRVVPKPPYHVQATDVLTIQVEGGFPDGPTGGGPEAISFWSMRPAGSTSARCTATRSRSAT